MAHASGPETVVDPPPPPPIRRIGNERLWNAPAAVVLGFAFALLGTIIVEVAGSAFGSNINHPTPAVNIIADYVFDAAFVLAALYFVFIGGRPQASDFGYRKVRLKVGLTAAVAAGVGYYLVTWGYGELFNITGKDKLPNELGVQHHTAALVGATVFVCVVAPTAEEFFFRGFFFGTLRKMNVTIKGRQVGTLIAALITAFLFGLAHTGSASPQYLVPLGFLGFVLCLVRWRTGSLYPCMALHSFNNCLALGVNQEHWTALEIVALTAGAWAVIGIVTLPLSRRTVPLVNWRDARPADPGL